MRRRADTSPTIEIPRHLKARVVPLPSVYTHVSTYRYVTDERPKLDVQLTFGQINGLRAATS